MDEQRHTVEKTEESEQTVRSESAIRARRWAIAAIREPGAYGIPELPAWPRVKEGGGVAFVQKGETEPFISADEPTRVRR